MGSVTQAEVDQTNRLIAQAQQTADVDPEVASLRELQRLADAKRATQKDEPEDDGLRPTHGDLQLTRFLSRRIEEANLLESFHLLPDDRPWAQQPFWKTRIWLAYLQGLHSND